MAESENGTGGPGPAYVAYPSLVSFFQRLKEHGVPAQIDKSVMDGFSGGTQSHLMSALRFLKLIKGDNAPSPRLRPLVDSLGTSDWADKLRPVVMDAYEQVLGDTDVASATPAQLQAKFRAVGMESSTLDKAMRFFLAVVKEAKIEHSPHLGRRRRASGPRRQQPRRNADDRPAAGDDRRHTDDREDSESQEQGMISFPIHLPGKPVGRIVVPQNISQADCKMLGITLQYIENYAAQREAAQ